jgi:hypothetical protein
MGDVPEACPFCGADRDVDPNDDWIEWECGTYDSKQTKLTEDGITSLVRDPRCLRRELAQLRPKAEAMDRLASWKSLDDKRSVSWTWPISGRMFIHLRDWTRGVTGVGDDLTSAVDHAVAQWEDRA